MAIGYSVIIRLFRSKCSIGRYSAGYLSMCDVTSQEGFYRRSSHGGKSLRGLYIGCHADILYHEVNSQNCSPQEVTIYFDGLTTNIVDHSLRCPSNIFSSETLLLFKRGVPLATYAGIENLSKP